MLIENSAKAVILRGNKILLIRNIDEYGDWYCLPGGRQQFGETLHETLTRECKEEIGITPVIKNLMYVKEYIHGNHEFRDKGRNQHKIEFIFMCAVDDDANPIFGSNIDDSQKEIVWCLLSDVSQLNIYPRRLKNIEKLLFTSHEVYWGDEL
jgi:ADP-ribose pyrophosphatase YjhB (NUDIX family)